MKKILPMLAAVALLLCLWAGAAVSADAAGELSIDNATVSVGDTFTVAVRIDQNPGITQANLWVSYDPAVLELVERAQGSFRNISWSSSTADNPFSIRWTGVAGSNSTATGIIAELTFQVIATQPCITPLRVDSGVALTVNAAGQTVPFPAAVGYVYVDTALPGDVDDDGAVSAQDIAVLQRYLAAWDVSVNRAAADVRGDGVVNNRDLALLQRYVSGWNVVLDGAVAVPAADVILPAVDYDLDGKGRILVENTYTVGGTAFVVLRNKSTLWTLPETTQMTYTCYDAAGVSLGTRTLYIGAMDTKRNKEKAFALSMPEGTAEIRFNTPKFDYWTEWA